jgi:RNA polymerase sigma factor (sigma-70 family)
MIGALPLSAANPAAEFAAPPPWTEVPQTELRVAAFALIVAWVSSPKLSTEVLHTQLKLAASAVIAAWAVSPELARAQAIVKSRALELGEDPEDLSQGVLERLLRQPASQILSIEHYGPYLTRGLENGAINRYRRQRNANRARPLLEIEAANRTNGNTVDDHLLGSTLEVVMDRLPPRQREVVRLRYCEGLSEGDTAAKLGISLGTVKSQSSRGLHSLRRHLAARGIASAGEALTL